MATAPTRCFGDVEFGPDASIDAWAGDWRTYRLRFFDHVVKGAALNEPAVRVFVMGGGSGTAQRGGQPGARRTLDQRHRLAAARRRPGRVPPAQRRPAGSCRASRRRRAGVIRLRSRASGADDRRGDEQPGAGRLRRKLGPEGGAGLLRLHAALPAARVTPRRAGVPDAGAARAGAGGRADRGGALGGHRRRRTPTSPPS